MKPSPSSEHDEHDQEIINILKDLGSFRSTYPSELLAARRAAFFEQVERLSASKAVEELSPADQEIVKLLGRLKSAPEDYPADLLAARRSAFLRQMEQPRATSLWDRFRVFLPRLFPSPKITPSPPAGFLRISLVAASLVAALYIGSLFLSRMDGAVRPAPSQVVRAPTYVQPSHTPEAAITICSPEEQTSPCPPGEFGPGQDLADVGNGVARPAVSKDARSHANGGYEAAYVNDGRSGASWVSDSADSWIKIDLGKVTAMNTVSIQRGGPDSSGDADLGSFTIAVAVSDEYANGDSSQDEAEYAQVFRSERSGIRGLVSPAETIRIEFPPVQARFVKITFEKAGAAIEEVGVFMVEPEFTEQPTGTPRIDTPTTTLTSAGTNTPSPTGTATSVPTGTSRSTATAVPTATTVPTLTKTLPPSSTPILPPTNTSSPTDAPLPLPTDPLPTDTPVPLPTLPAPTIVQPTILPPTTVLPTASPASTDPIIVTGNDQSLSFICNDNAVEIRGHVNTVILLGSCSSITVTGNQNHVYWQFGSPVITDRGTDNIIEQL